VRLQKDNESLQGKHSLHVSLQQAEDFILPEAAEVKHFKIINTTHVTRSRWKNGLYQKADSNNAINNNLDFNPLSL